jgi:hypothetical protein
MNAENIQNIKFIKEKQELVKLKNELDEFYKVKEEEYKINKNKLTSLNTEIQKKLDLIEKTKKDNQKILDEISLKLSNKAILMYGKMKIKIVKNIMEEKIAAGQINEVFDIITRLKTKRVMQLLKKFDTKTSTQLMDMLEKNKDKSKGI